MTRREFKGAAERLTTSGGLAATGDLTFTSVTTPSAGWPTGAGGKFLIAVDRGLASEEKMLATSRTTNSFAVLDADRGYDGTTKQSHASGAGLEHVLGAIDLDEPNDHINTTANDDHTQYLNVTRHAAVDHEALLTTLPRGRLGHADVTATLAVTTAEADLAGLTVTFTPEATRQIEITALLNIVADVSGGNIQLRIKEGATVLGLFVHTVSASGFAIVPLKLIVSSPTVAAHTYKLSAQGSGSSFSVNSTSAYHSTLLVADIGG